MSPSPTPALDGEDWIEKGEVERGDKKDKEVEGEVCDVGRMGVEVGDTGYCGDTSEASDSSVLDCNSRDAAGLVLPGYCGDGNGWDGERGDDGI
jgi:hypothetical protein